jgi:hypothetical protein
LGEQKTADTKAVTVNFSMAVRVKHGYWMRSENFGCPIAEREPWALLGMWGFWVLPRLLPWAAVEATVKAEQIIHVVIAL